MRTTITLILLIGALVVIFGPLVFVAQRGSPSVLAAPEMLARAGLTPATPVALAPGQAAEVTCPAALLTAGVPTDLTLSCPAATPTATAVASPIPTPAASPTPPAWLYNNGLVNGWVNYSWGASVNLANPSPTRGGATAIALAYGPFGGLNFHNNNGVAAPATGALTFWLNGGTAGVGPIAVYLYDQAGQIPHPQTLASWLPGGVVPTNAWVFVSIPLASLGSQGEPLTGFLLQDASGKSQPTFYVDLVGLASGAGPAPTASPAPVASPTAGAFNWGASEPFAGVPNAPDESFQSKGAEQWVPLVRAAVNDAVNAHLLNEGERHLFENLLLGTIDVESTGHVFLVASNQPSYGLTQGTFPWLEYAEEDPFDPLTNVRGWLRNLIRSYRHDGNRADQMIGEYLTGQPGDAGRYLGDGNTTGDTYFRRVINAVWWVHQDHLTGQVYPPRSASYQDPCNGPSCFYDRAPLWSIWDAPNLAFNWVPLPNTSQWNYYQAGVDANIARPIATNTWYPMPAWFVGAAPEPDVPAQAERAATAAELAAYPVGRTLMASTGGYTYPTRTFTVANP